MDLPPSGWYPDPYGTPRLLRWWDGASWTQHTHPDPTAGGAGTAGGEAATSVQSTAVQSTVAQSAAARPQGVESTTVGATAVQPSADWLSRTKPPTGPRTAPQPALPSSPGVAATAVQSPVQPTAVQSPVQPTAYQPAAYEATAYQPAAYPPTAYQPAGVAGVNDGGTQVLFTGDNPWALPGGLGSGAPAGPGGPGGPGGPRFGYLEAQRRRRRRLLIAGLAAGTAVAVAMIAVIATTLGASPSSTAADRTPAAHKHKTAPPASPASASPSATASPTPSNGSLLSDGQSGLSYTQLPPPWQGPSCPGSLNSGGFTWTAGEYAVAGEVNGGSTTWYGDACSGLLPVQFGYQGAASLQPTAASLANSFENTYYNGLDHTITQGLSQPVTVSGHAGWEVTYQVSYTNAAQGTTWTDEQAAVVVVDPGTGNEPSVFFASVPGNLGANVVASLASSLQYSAPVGITSPGGGAPSGAPSDGTGGAGAAGGNPGNGHGHGGGNGSNP